MNELYLNDCYIYFKTKETSAKEAMEKLEKICWQNGIELCVYHAFLRNEDGEDIDEYEG